MTVTVTAAPRPSPATPAVVARRRIPQRWSALLVLCLSLLLIMLDNTVLNVALPTLVRDLQATSTDLQWIVDSYALLFAGFMLVAGSLADRYGRKRTFMAGMVVFGAGSVAASLSDSVSTLVVSRAAMGLGAAFIMPSTLSLITDMFRDPVERQRAIGAWAGMSGLGVALGPIVAGVLLAHFFWGSVFLVNVPVVVAAVVLAIRLVPDSRDAVRRRLDLVGATVSTGGLGLVLWSLIEAPTRGWSSAAVLGVGGGGLMVLAAFVAWERHCDHPMLSLAFFRERSFSVATSMAGLTMFALFGALFMLTQFLQFGLGFSPLEAGVRVLPAAGMLAVAAPLSSPSVRVLGTKLTVAAGVLVIAGGLWQISWASATSTYGDVVAGMVMLGLGAGLVVPSATAAVMSTLPRGRTGVGAATNGVSIQVGGALGVAVIGSLLATRYQDRIAESLAPFAVPPALMETIRGSIGGALEVASRAGGAIGATLSSVAREAFVSGMDLGLVVGAFVAVGGAILALAALPGRVRTRHSEGAPSPASAPLTPRGAAPRAAVRDRHRCR